jgi:hypothetical protein
MMLDAMLGAEVSEHAHRELTSAVSAERAHLSPYLHLGVCLQLDDGLCSLVL